MLEPSSFRSLLSPLPSSSEPLWVEIGPEGKKNCAKSSKKVAAALCKVMAGPDLHYRRLIAHAVLMSCSRQYNFSKLLTRGERKFFIEKPKSQLIVFVI